MRPDTDHPEDASAVPVGLLLSGDGLTELGSQSARHVAFSLTEACPLACRHCIVSTVAAGVRSRTMPLEQAKAYASQLSALAERGVKFISFTGGEPLLAQKQMRLISAAAAAAGMRCTVVTGCHWGSSVGSARRVVERFPFVSNWHLSADVFHEEFVPVEYVVNAARACVDAGRETAVRMAATIPLSRDHERLCLYLRRELPAGTDIVVQPVTRSGRGASIETDIATSDMPGWPCIPNGMVVRWDGTVSPCCGGLVDQRAGHPFAYERADAVGLRVAHQAWCTDPLLQLIRTAGFAPLLQWTQEAFPDNPILSRTPRHPCDCCLGLWKDPRLVVELRRRAELPANRAKIAALAKEVFGESFGSPPQQGSDSVNAASRAE